MFMNFFRNANAFLEGLYIAQHCLLARWEKWKQAVDNSQAFGALLTDLSKAVDSLPHEVLITELNAYGFRLKAFKLMNNYLSKNNQRTKINESSSSWEQIIFGVPQGSVLGPILFNIFLIDFFLILKNIDIASYADDNALYKALTNVDATIKTFKNVS